MIDEGEGDPDVGPDVRGQRRASVRRSDQPAVPARAPKWTSSTTTWAAASRSRIRTPSRPAAAVRRSTSDSFVRSPRSEVQGPGRPCNPPRSSSKPGGQPAAGAPASATSSSACSSGRRGTSARKSSSTLIRREDARISRATIYRTLQWMVDAGIARRVDFGEGRFRFEHSYRHPRHFHLICKTLQPVVRVPELGHRGADRGGRAARAVSRRAQSVLQMLRHVRELPDRAHGQRAGGADRERVRARRAADRDCDRAQRPRVLHARGAHHARRARPQGVRAASPTRRRSTSASSRRATASSSPQNPTLEAQPTFLFFKGAANGLFAAGTEELKKGVRRSAARCSSASAASAARTSSSRDTASGSRSPRASASSSSSPTRSASTWTCSSASTDRSSHVSASAAAGTAGAAAPRDRPPPAHDGLRRPVHSRRARRRGGGGRRRHARRHRPRHRRRGRRRAGRRAAAPGSR